MDRITVFPFRGKDLPVIYVDTKEVFPGVVCDEYLFVGDDSKDLAIITIQPGHKTKWQRVLKGKKTIEGYRSGIGSLTIIQIDGTRKTYNSTGARRSFSAIVEVGEIMQWAAAPDAEIVVSEVCIPTYREGRYEIVAEEDLPGL